MNKKIILAVVSSAMLAVIITAVLLNRNSIISKYSNGTKFGYDMRDAADETDDIEENAEGSYETFTEPEGSYATVYEMGTAAECSCISDEPGDGEMDKFTICVNSVQKVSRVTNLPASCADCFLGVNSDGTPEDGVELVAADITIRNISSHEYELCLGNILLNDSPSIFSTVGTMVMRSGFERAASKSAFIVNIAENTELNTKVVYAVEQENGDSLPEVMYIVSNPSGFINDTEGSAAIKITLDGEANETDI